MKHDMVWYDLIDQFRIRTLPNRLTTSAHLTRSPDSRRLFLQIDFLKLLLPVLETLVRSAKIVGA